MNALQITITAEDNQKAGIYEVLTIRTDGLIVDSNGDTVADMEYLQDAKNSVMEIIKDARERWLE